MGAAQTTKLLQRQLDEKDKVSNEKEPTETFSGPDTETKIPETELISSLVAAMASLDSSWRTPQLRHLRLFPLPSFRKQPNHSHIQRCRARRKASSSSSLKVVDNPSSKKKEEEEMDCTGRVLRLVR